MRIGLMVLNLNGVRWLPPLYESLRRQTGPSFIVYLVDNASTDESVPLTRRSFPEVKVLRMPRNLGYSVAYNVALRHVLADGCDWVIWCNNDIRLETDCLAELACAASRSGKTGILGPAFLEWDGDGPNYYMRGAQPGAIAAMRSRCPTPLPVEWVEGSFLMVSRQCLEDTGPLDPYLFFYWEEADFCRRARFRGWNIALVPTALARHYAGGSTAGDESAAFQRLKTRNYYIYTLTNPRHSWSRNVRAALHLLLVRLKAGCLRNVVDIGAELAVFIATLGEWRTIHAKWARDRAGLHPSTVPVGEAAVEVQVLGGENVPA